MLLFFFPVPEKWRSKNVPSFLALLEHERFWRTLSSENFALLAAVVLTRAFNSVIIALHLVLSETRGSKAKGHVEVMIKLY